MVKNKLTSPEWDTDISIAQIEGVDYFRLNDMLSIVNDKDKNIDDWLRNKGTLESIGYWEKKYTPDFKYGEFSVIRNSPSNARFSAKQLAAYGGKGVVSRLGKYGGTYAHKDLAIDFAMWLSPEFKFNVIHVYEKYLDAINNNVAWQMQRLLSKTTLRLLTDAIKNEVIPYEATNPGIVYAREIDKHNVLAFGERAREWRAKNPELAMKKMSQRDRADIYSLAILSSLQSYDRILINKGHTFEARQLQLHEVAKDQIQFYFNPDTINDNSPLGLGQ
jgi:hypothetical protein